MDVEHEYFANGILVSNCDAVLYGYRRAIHWLPRPEPEKLAMPGSLEWHEQNMKRQNEALEKQLAQEIHEADERRRERADLEQEDAWL